MWIKANDTVRVLTGDDAGSQGRVLRVQPKAGKLVVEGINRVYKHVRRSQRNPQGGRLSMEMAIPLSNVALVCPSCKEAARFGARLLADGGKERYCKKCGAGNGVISPDKSKLEKKK
jgi:large subunit ribosomal protein L24